MNYEAKMAGDYEQLTYTGEDTGRRRRRWIIIGLIGIVVLIVASVFVLSGSGGDGAKGAEKGKGAGAASRDDGLPLVSVAVPGRRTIENVVTGTGSLAAKRDMPVGIVGEGGMVTRVLVEPGAWVREGQVLATVDRSVQAQTAESMEAQVRVARADAQLAENELQRAQTLVGRGFISKADVDRRTATRDAARARVRVAEATLAETRARNRRLDIRAPAAGLVLTRNVEPGQIVSAGSGVLFRIAQGGQMEMRTQLAEGDLHQLRVGAGAQVTPVGSNQNYAGRVWQVSPVIDPQSRQGIARIEVPYNAALRPGGFASARIVAGTTTAPLLPQSAVLSDTRGSFVYVLDAKDQAQRRNVRVGDVSDQGVVIADGLNGTERVVLTAGAFLNPGQKVKPTLQKLN